MPCKTKIVGFFLAALGLFACNPEDKAATGPDGSVHSSGSARIALPALPPGYLAKADSGSSAVFDLTVSGPGMAPIRKSWTLYPNLPGTVTVTGIPVGAERVFTGRLIQAGGPMDSSGTVTHEGSDTAAIFRDSVADVRLFLRAVGGGSANVCVQVEGWQSDSSCIVPSVPDPRRFAGCWHVPLAQAAGGTLDSLNKTWWRFTQSDSQLSLIITYASGGIDSAFGFVRSDGIAVIGYDSGSAFSFKGFLRSQDSGKPADLTLFGHLNVPSKGISVEVQGSRGECAAINPPMVPGDTACYAIRDTLNGGQKKTGRLGVRNKGGFVMGYFRWAGYATAFASGSFPVTGPLASASVDLVGSAPVPLKQGGIPKDSLAYAIRFVPGATARGTVKRLAASGWLTIGTWNAAPAACTEADFKP